MKTPYPFILDALEGVPIHTRPMFGCLAVYLGEKIVIILRQKSPGDRDNGCWVATVPEHHESLAEDFPSLRSIELFGPSETTWRNLPESAPDFESSALEICECIRRGDPRVGKVPAKRSRKKKKAPKKKNGAVKAKTSPRRKPVSKKKKTVRPKKKGPGKKSPKSAPKKKTKKR